MRLGDAVRFERCIVVEREQGERQIAHAGAISGIAVRLLTSKRALGDVTLDAAPAGVADIHRAGAQPACKALGHGARVEAAAFDDRIAQRKRHRGVVGNLAGFELEPAATEHPVVRAVLAGDLAGVMNSTVAPSASPIARPR